jgi:lambda family phage tail tape measure protein
MATKAQLEFTADASGVKTGVEQAKRSLADLGATAVTEGKKAAAGIDAVAAGAKKSADGFSREEGRIRSSIQRVSLDLQTLGKAASEKFEAKISLQGLDATKFQPYIAQLKALEQQQKAAEEALKNTPKSLDKVGVSAAQTAAALRGVPAQFTDIVTSLQGGQNPLTVLLQQGGQLKDMFGGVGPAARALGTYVAGLVSPFTIAGAAVGVLAIALYQATERSTAFNKAIVASGNFAGQTAASLTALSEKIGATVGTQSKAADALTALASSGRIAGGVLEQVGSAVVAQNKLMGTSVEDAVAQYVKLADEPTKASAKLNESLNYLNQATYERIRTLEEQGDKEAATALAQTTLANATLSRMRQVREESGYLARALSFVAREASNMWSNLSNNVASIGARPSIATLREELQKSRSGPLSGSRFEKNREGELEARIAAEEETERLARRSSSLSADRAAAEQAKIAASQRLADQKKATRSRKEQREDELEDFKRDAKTAGLVGKDYDDGVARINAKFKDPKGPKDKTEKAFQDDAAAKMLQTLRQTEASLADQLDGELKITEAQKKQVEFQQLVADLKDKKILTADQKSLIAGKEAIEAQLQKNVELSNQIEYEKKIVEITKKANEEAKEMARTFAGINLSLESSGAGRREQYDRILSTAGLGTRARQEVEAEQQIRSEAQRARRQADEAASKVTGGFDSKEYQDETAKIKGALNEQLNDLREFYAKDRENRESWVVGARQAFSNYTDEASNAAKHTEEAFGNALKGVEDQLTSLFTGGKFDGKKLLGDIGTDLTRNFVKERITGPLSDLAGKAFGGGGALGGLLGSKGGQLGATAMNPLYVRLADSLGGIGSAAGAGSSGGGLLGTLGSLVGAFGGVGAQASVASALPGDSLDNIFRLTGNFAKFDGGGYTGPGGKYDPAGIVHAGEYVFTAESTKSLGVDFLNRLNRRGYADGGYVGAIMGGNLQKAGASEGQTVSVVNHWNVGDIPTMSMLKQAVAGSEARIIGGLRRNRSYGGEASA